MTTYKLTPKNPDLYTGLQNSYVAWHFVDEDALDIFGGMKWLKVYQGWDYHLAADPENPLLQRVSLTKRLGTDEQMVTVLVTDTQWFAFEHGHIQTFEDADVTANYDVETYTLPPDPPMPVDPNAPVFNPAPMNPPPPLTGGAPSVDFPPPGPGEVSIP